MLTSQLRRAAPAAAALLGLAASLTAAQPAAAAIKGVWKAHPVAYDDLDLTQDGGVRRLEQRVARAVRIVCGPTPATRASAKDQAECVAAASANARTQVERAVTARRLCASERQLTAQLHCQRSRREGAAPTALAAAQ